MRRSGTPATSRPSSRMVQARLRILASSACEFHFDTQGFLKQGGVAVVLAMAFMQKWLKVPGLCR